MTRLKTEATKLENIKAEAVALFFFEDDKNHNHAGINRKLGGKIDALIKEKKFSGKKGSHRCIDTLGKLKAEAVILIGLGKKEELCLEGIRRAAATVAVAAKTAGAATAALSIEGLVVDGETETSMAEAAGEGVLLSQYSFTKFKKKPKEKKPELTSVIFSQIKNGAAINRGITAAGKIAEAVFIARDLQNTPPNVASPTFIAAVAKRECSKAGVKFKVLGKKQIEALKMGSFLSVAAGSDQEPKFLIMEHLKGAKNGKPTVLVGKGVTFDTGGISIKPSAGMDEMKFDMSGGAAVIGAICAAGKLKLKKNIVALVPLTENMPSGKATRPGDVVKASDGQTIEILNTDAEGRLILADALVYAKRYNPARVVDIATLTGAIMVSLGSIATGLFGTDQKLMDDILKSGEATGERCWQFPIWEEYEKMIDSKIADMQNIGERWGGSITAAAFLKRFTDYPWAHLDIAGTANGAKPNAPYKTAGGWGTGVRLLLDLVR